MPKAIYIANGTTDSRTGASTNYVVHTPTGRILYIYSQGTNNSASSLFCTYSDDEGLTWKRFRIATAITGITQVAVWYDRWSDINADLIHVAYTNSVDDDVRYTTVDASSLATTTDIVAFLGASTATGCSMSITRARGGNLILCGTIDAAAEIFNLKSTAVGASASFSTIATVTEATTDQLILMPGWNADTQDVMAFFWDQSTSEISVKRYDDSANTWAETSISTGMTLGTAATAYGHFSACVDLANSRNYLAAWSAADQVNADLRVWYVNDTTITETSANAVLNSSDDQGIASISLDIVSGRIRVYYAGKSDGTQTWPTSVGVYFKDSTDTGATWGSETEARAADSAESIAAMPPCPRHYGRDMVAAVLHRDSQFVFNTYLICEPAGRMTTNAIGIS